MTKHIHIKIRSICISYGYKEGADRIVCSGELSSQFNPYLRVFHVLTYLPYEIFKRSFSLVRFKLFSVWNFRSNHSLFETFCPFSFCYKFTFIKLSKKLIGSTNWMF